MTDRRLGAGAGAARGHHIVIADGEPQAASSLARCLRANGFAATTTGDGAEALALVRAGEPDLVILDLGMSVAQGFDVLEGLRRVDPRLPVIVLNPRHDTADAVRALERGADDYVTRPFRLAELLARIRARLRDEASPAPVALSGGGITLDLRTRRLHVDGRPMDVTAREFALLETFLRHPGQVLSREQLLGQVWGYDHGSQSNVVEVYVGYLRRKVGSDRIRTLRGMGYRFDPHGDDEARSEGAAAR